MNIECNGITQGIQINEIEADSSHYSPLKKTFPKIGTEPSEWREEIGFPTERTHRIRQQREQTERDCDVPRAGEEK